MTQSLRVLSIEDDPVDAYLISSASRRWGGEHLELVAARSLGEGLALLTRAEPSVVLRNWLKAGWDLPGREPTRSSHRDTGCRLRANRKTTV